jgi:hypothetical protein
MLALTSVIPVPTNAETTCLLIGVHGDRLTAAKDMSCGLTSSLSAKMPNCDYIMINTYSDANLNF